MTWRRSPARSPTISFRRWSPRVATPRRLTATTRRRRHGGPSSTGSSRMRNRVPWALRGPVRRARNALALQRALARQRTRWAEIASTPPRRGSIAVSYGLDRMPSVDDVVYGGHVKFSLLDEELPNAPRDFNVLYLGSSAMPLEARRLVELARTRGAAFAWNQNGVAYRGWYGEGWQLVNEPRAWLLHAADH